MAQRFKRCDKVVGRERLSAAEVPYGCSSPWQYRIQLLFRHGFDFSEAEPVSDGKNGAALRGRFISLSRAGQVSAT
jgi:hypothetical protein